MKFVGHVHIYLTAPTSIPDGDHCDWNVAKIFDSCAWNLAGEDCTVRRFITRVLHVLCAGVTRNTYKVLVGKPRRR